MKSTKITCKTNLQYGNCQPFWISIATMMFQQYQPQKWIQHPWIMWNRGITLASETKSTKITLYGNFQYGHWQPSLILVAKITFQPRKSQKWIQCPWMIWNKGITLASETESTKIMRNGKFQYGHWQPSWISVAKIIFQPRKSQKRIQCPWIIWNKGITLASETKSTKIIRNGNFSIWPLAAILDFGCKNNITAMYIPEMDSVPLNYVE